MEQTLEDKIAATPAPKVTPEQIADTIVKEQYIQHEGTLVITCALTLRNGFNVTGESACASPENFREDIGREIAKKNAAEKIWPLLGYELKTKLAMIAKATPPSMLDADVLTYVGTKVVHACPMSRGAYNKLRGWELPADEDGDDEGYLVEYADGGAPNLKGFKGYVSWSPKDVFEGAYTTGTILKKTNHIERMEVELQELTERCTKLRAFLQTPVFSSLVPRERADMTDQLNAMENYAWYLGSRLRRAAGQSH